TLDHLERFAVGCRAVLVDRDVIGYAVSLADATRNPREYGLDDIAPYIEYGASPRGPIGMVQAARALALLRGRGHATAGDVRDLAHGRAARAPAGPGAHADDVDRPRRLAVDGLRDDAAAEGRRGRGCGPGARAPRGASRRARGAADLRRRQAAAHPAARVEARL